MPKLTFTNLSEEKRQIIMDVVINEFSKQDYKSVSISKICSESKIAKGSFYQYFSDKKDLYSYLLKYIGEKKMVYFAKYQDQMDMGNTFDFLRLMYVAGIEFSYNNPKLYQVSKFFMNLTEEFRKDLLGDLASTSNNFLVEMFENGKKSGMIRKDVKSQFIAKLVTDMSNSISEYYFSEYQGNEIEKDSFLDIANEMVDVLEKGIKCNNKLGGLK